MKPLPRRLYAIAAIVLAALVFAGVNVALDATVVSARLDLTENSRFTLSRGTRNIIRNLKEPVRLRFFFSRKAAADYAQTSAYAGRVRDLLQRYADLSGGKIVVEAIDPEPFTPEEDEATAAGITPAPTDSGEQVYFGLVGSNRIDGREAVPYFSPEREPYLEYDLSSLIYRLSSPEKPKLAILSGLPLDTGMGGMEAMMRGQSRPFAIYREIAKAYDVEMLPADFNAVSADAGVLMIVQPGNLSEAQLYAIDQFAMKGGRIVAFVDPDSELMGAGAPPYARPASASSLPLLFQSWGIEFNPKKEVADLKLAQKVQTSNNPANPVTLYPVWLHVVAQNFDARDPVTANMQTLNLASAGALFPLKGATTHFSPLVQSSDRAALVDAVAVRATMQPDELTGSIVPAGKPFVIAARVSGPAKTAFPDGLPGNTAARIGSTGHLNVIVMADSDIFDDRFWVRTAEVYGRQMAAAFADNGAFALNSIENLMGSDDLISLRTRAAGDKPFTLVRALQADAETQYRQEAEALQAHLTQTQSRLRELQSGEGGGKDLAMTPKQQAEIERFKRELTATRASLRDVQHNLRKDIDLLGGFLAFVNIALMPLLVTGFALILAGVRRRRRARAVRI